MMTESAPGAIARCDVSSKTGAAVPLTTFVNAVSPPQHTFEFKIYGSACRPTAEDSGLWVMGQPTLHRTPLPSETGTFLALTTVALSPTTLSASPAPDPITTCATCAN